MTEPITLHVSVLRAAVRAVGPLAGPPEELPYFAAVRLWTPSRRKAAVM